MDYLKAFLAGFLATLLFHQGMLAILHAVGATPRKPYAMDPTEPLHVPAVISLAFWGGIWGILLWLILARHQGSSSYWLLAAVIGAIAPSIVALFVVAPLKGQPVAGGGKPAILIGALLLNGAWGIGVALLMAVFHPTRSMAAGPAAAR
jgi:hypothetical protein